MVKTFLAYVLLSSPISIPYFLNFDYCSSPQIWILTPNIATIKFVLYIATKNTFLSTKSNNSIFPFKNKSISWKVIASSDILPYIWSLHNLALSLTPLSTLCNFIFSLSYPLNAHTPNLLSLATSCYSPTKQYSFLPLHLEIVCFFWLLTLLVLWIPRYDATSPNCPCTQYSYCA